MNKFEELKALIEKIESNGDVRKFYERNNGTAGIRLRLNMQDVKIAVQEVRNEVSEIRKEREAKKTKKRKNDNINY